MIIKATHTHINEIHQIFQKVTDEMVKNEIFQWNGSYPALEDIQKDIDVGNCYVMVNDENDVLATITVNENQDVQYQNIEWKNNDEGVFVIHRLAVDPSVQGLGIGRKMCEWAEVIAKQQGGRIIRLDAYAGNSYSNRLYHGLGYNLAKGYCYFHGNNLPFYCYEKRIF